MPVKNFRNKSCSWYSYYKLPFHRTTLWLEETQWFRIQCNLSLSGTSLSVFYVQQTAHKLILLQRYWRLHYNIGINVSEDYLGHICVISYYSWSSWTFFNHLPSNNRSNTEITFGDECTHDVCKEFWCTGSWSYSLL